MNNSGVWTHKMFQKFYEITLFSNLFYVKMCNNILVSIYQASYDKF